MTDPPEFMKAEDQTPTVTPNASLALAIGCERMVELKALIDEREGELKQLKQEYDKWRKEQVPDILRTMGLVSDDGKASLTLPIGYRVHLRVDRHVSLVKEHEQAFKSWLDLRCLTGELYKETVHPATLKAWVNARMEHGEEVPQDMLSMFTEQTAILTKVR